MKISLFFALLILAFPSRAQTAAVGQKIEYRRDLPSIAVNRMPSGSKSCFWGTFQLKRNSALLGIHLIDPNWKGNQQRYRKGEPVLLLADFYNVGSPIPQFRRRYSLIYRGYIVGRMRFEIESAWLDPKTKQSPIFKIRAFGRERNSSYVESAGNEIFLTFPEGLAKRYAVQSFAIGYWRASDTLGQDVSYASNDKRGLIQIKTNESLNEDDNPSRITLYQWNGRKWNPGKSVLRKR